MFTALCVVAVLAMALLPFYARWQYRQDHNRPTQEYPRTYHVLWAVMGEAMLATALIGGIATAATFDFHRGIPPFPEPIATILTLLGVGFTVIAIASFVPLAVIMFRSPGARRKR
ncbi:MAG TPA: hypothetical protein VFU88_19900 [Ktedonobacterales bacterium]|nr:hypothetical protein [Ktedonobacterales bacterium]